MNNIRLPTLKNKDFSNTNLAKVGSTGKIEKKNDFNNDFAVRILVAFPPG